MMNLLARILSHGFALAVVVLIAVALMYRGDLFPEWELPEFLVVENDSDTGTGEKPDSVEHIAADTAGTEPSATVPAAIPQVDVVEEAEEPAAMQPAEVTAAETAAAPTEPMPAAELEGPETQQEEAVVTTTDGYGGPDATAGTDSGESAAAIPEMIEPDAGDAAPYPAEDTREIAPSVTDTTSAVVTEQAEDIPSEPPAADLTDDGGAEQAEPAVQEMETSTAVTEQVPDQEPVPEPAVAAVPTASAEDADGKTAYTVLAAAREAYWLHDYVAAEKHYQQLIQLEPDNPDGYGELGNLYFAQGQWEPAAAAYYEAGVRLLKDGMTVQARQMVDVIRGLNGGQADDLEQQINAAQ